MYYCFQKSVRPSKGSSIQNTTTLHQEQVCTDSILNKCTFSFSVCRACCCPSSWSLSANNSPRCLLNSVCSLEEVALAAISLSHSAIALSLSTTILSESDWRRDFSLESCSRAWLSCLCACVKWEAMLTNTILIVWGKLHMSATKFTCKGNFRSGG